MLSELMILVSRIEISKKSDSPITPPLTQIRWCLKHSCHFWKHPWKSFLEILRRCFIALFYFITYFITISSLFWPLRIIFHFVNKKKMAWK